MMSAFIRQLAQSVAHQVKVTLNELFFDDGTKSSCARVLFPGLADWVTTGL